MGRVGSGHRRLLTLGGATGRWVVTDDAGTELASAQSRVVVDELRVETRGRKVVVKLAGKKGLMGTHDRLSGVDHATGATVLEGERRSVCGSSGPTTRGIRRAPPSVANGQLVSTRRGRLRAAAGPGRSRGVRRCPATAPASPPPVHRRVGRGDDPFVGIADLVTQIVERLP